MSVFSPADIGPLRGYTARWKCACGADNNCPYSPTAEIKCGLCPKLAPVERVQGLPAAGGAPVPIVPAKGPAPAAATPTRATCPDCKREHAVIIAEGRSTGDCPYCKPTPAAGKAAEAEARRQVIAVVRTKLTKVGTCKTCGKEVLFWTNEKGNVEPVDSAPARTLVPVRGENGQVESLQARSAFISHFITCPQRDQHRKAKP